MATSDRPAVGVDHPTVVPTNLGESDDVDAGADTDASAGADGATGTE